MRRATPPVRSPLSFLSTPPTMAITNLDDLFLHLLKDIYYAEKQILKALPDMIRKASNAELQQAFQEAFLQSTRSI